MNADATGSSSSPPLEFEAPPEPGERIEAVRAGRTVMSCDAPSPEATNAPVSRPVRVVGWAYSRAGIDSVTVLVDGETSVVASYGLFRSDVADALTEAGARRCGFSAVLGPDVCEPGPHELAIVAVDRHGAATGMTLRVVAKDDGDGWAEGLFEEKAEPSLVEEEAEAERYVPELHRGLPLEAEHQARYGWAAPLAQGRDVLDAGCGVGWGTIVLADAGARRTVGLDIDEGALADARERAQQKAEFVRGDLLALPFDEDCFDLVVSFEAIEHVTDPNRALDEMRRVLRPGGILAISSPNKGVYPAGNRFHLHELSASELEAALSARFDQLRMYRQESHTGALITDDLDHALQDPRREVLARLYKTWGREAGDELYTLSLAGDDELPELRAVAVMAAPLDTKQLYERMAELEHRAMLNDAKLDTAKGRLEQLAAERDRVRAALDHAEQERVAAQRAVDDLQASLSWRVTAPLRRGKEIFARVRSSGTE